MWHERRILDLLNIQHPIIQAPMAGATSPELVAAVSEAGGLGSFGAAATPPQALRATISAIRSQTDRPFHVNLFAADTETYDREARPGPRLKSQLQRYHDELGLAEVPAPAPMFGPARDQLELLVEENVAVISFHFGVDADTVIRAQTNGAKVLCSATTPAEAETLEQAGVDAIIAQGSEAGGHRGTFAADPRQAMIGTLALVPQIVDAVSVPVIAAGGIMDARGLVACLALGASAVQMGTAFLGCPEAPIAEVWRRSLLRSDGSQTTVTRAVSGKPARALRNRYIEEIESLDTTGEPLLPYPAQYSVSRLLRTAAAEKEHPEFLGMWAGQGVGLIKQRPAAELVKELVAETQQLLQALAGPVQ